ncbi:hypothetical protein MPER_03726 [Moniliophthora perniciosa FA553]|nr:hypothetical protein MPER_03726 [Moniliophthora perniciosa FA553]
MGQNSLAGQGVYERLKIIIVGAGLGGLAAAYCLGRAGHDVLVLESSSEPQGNVGAGIQICPNMTRILRRWGLQREIEQILRKDQPDSWSFYRWYFNLDRDGEFLGKDILGDQMEQTHGSPWFVCHRSDLY